jgi:hypothetical protein
MHINSLPTYYYKASMPNLCQRDAKSKQLKEHGEVYCGPTSVANAIIWLAKYHFSMLIPPSGNLSDHEAALKIIETLGEYMKTNEDGTEIIDTMEGLEKYIRDRGYNVHIEWKGIEDGGDYDKGKIPYQDWIKKGTIGPSNAILSIGLYNHEKEHYDLVEGHFVTAGGFKHIAVPLNPQNALLEDNSTSTDNTCIPPSQLIIHDPYPQSHAPDFCDLLYIPQGKDITCEENVTQPAHEYNEISGIYICEEDRQAGANSTVIDGGFVFTVTQ